MEPPKISFHNINGNLVRRVEIGKRVFVQAKAKGWYQLSVSHYLYAGNQIDERTAVRLLTDQYDQVGIKLDPFFAACDMLYEFDLRDIVRAAA